MLYYTLAFTLFTKIFTKSFLRKSFCLKIKNIFLFL